MARLGLPLPPPRTHDPGVPAGHPAGPLTCGLLWWDNLLGEARHLPILRAPPSTPGGVCERESRRAGEITAPILQKKKLRHRQAHQAPGLGVLSSGRTHPCGSSGPSPSAVPPTPPGGTRYLLQVFALLSVLVLDLLLFFRQQQMGTSCCWKFTF